MSKLTRVTAKVFGSSAGADQLGVFGSLAAGSPQFSTDPAAIQNLSNWLTGWFGAVIGGNSPAIEDLNAMSFVYGYQLAYVMQEGIPEYDAGTVYYTNSFCQSGGLIYQSLTDNNSGHTPSSGSPWLAQWITGASIVNNVNLLGKSVQENGNNLVVSNTNNTNSLSMVRGLVRVTFGSSGVTSPTGIVSGEGFTITIGASEVGVVYTTTFNDLPSVNVSMELVAGALSNGANTLIDNSTIGGYSIRPVGWTPGANVQVLVHFTAFAQRA